MTIEITGIITNESENTVIIEGTDLTKIFEAHSLREDFEAEEVQFLFDLNKAGQFRYLWKFISSQKRVKASGAKSIEDMLKECIGTITYLNDGFRKFD